MQIAKSFGADVTRVCSTTKVDLVRSLGADHVIDYPEKTHPGRPALRLHPRHVLNHSLSRLLYVLNPTGTLVPNGGQFHKRWIASTGVILIKAPLLSLLRSRRIRPVRLSRKQDELLLPRAVQALTRAAPWLELGAFQALCQHGQPAGRDRSASAALTELLESGKDTPVIDRTYPLSHTADAIGYFGQGNARGKVVITV